MTTHPFRVIVYGTNLNMGEFIAAGLQRHGVQAQLVRSGNPGGQESREWWTDQPEVPDTVFELPAEPIHWGRLRKLITYSTVRQLYEKASGADVILMMENGPALFSELENIPKVFLSQGADLQLIPFKLSVDHQPVKILRDMRRNPRAALARARDVLHDAGLQLRQRHGLRQCAAIICLPHQRRLLERLGLRNKPIYYCNFPMNPALLEELNTAFQNELRQRYRKEDLVFFHPTRHFYLRLNQDAYLKDNDKLIRAFARFVRTTQRSCRLVMVEKGRPRDLANSRALVENLGLRPFVDWIPEMPNKHLRAFYTLDRTVVCDQFNPNLASLGNIGREATFFGKPLITAFAGYNRLCYGNDWPTHILPAQTEEEILTAMHHVASMPPEWWCKIHSAARAWFDRHLHVDKVVTTYIDILRSAAAS